MKSCLWPEILLFPKCHWSCSDLQHRELHWGFTSKSAHPSTSSSLEMTGILHSSDIYCCTAVNICSNLFFCCSLVVVCFFTLQGCVLRLYKLCYKLSALEQNGERMALFGCFFDHFIEWSCILAFSNLVCLICHYHRWQQNPGISYTANLHLCYGCTNCESLMQVLNKFF